MTGTETEVGTGTETGIGEVATRIRTFGGGLLQLNSVLIAYIVGSQWLRAAGFYSYFGQSLPDVGYSIADLIISGTINATAAVLILAAYILIEVYRCRWPRWCYWLAIPAPLLISLIIGIATYDGPHDNYFTESYNLSLASIAIGFALVVVVARVVVRPTARLKVLAVVSTVMLGIALALLNYHSGRVSAEEFVRDADPRGVSASLGFATRFILVVKVVDPPERATPLTECGRLLGVGSGAYVVWYPKPSSASRDYINGANGVWRLPVDQTVLEPC